MSWIANNLTFLMVGLAVLLLLIIIGVLMVGAILQRRDRATTDGEPEPAGPPPTDFRQLTRTVARRVSAGARKVERVSSVDRVEELPWVGLVGLPGSSASELVDELVLPWQAEGNNETADLRIRVLREGVVVDYGEDVLDAPDWEQRWRAMVRGVRTQRPDRPLEGLVIAIPMSALVGPSAMSSDRLEAEGERLGELLGTTQAVTGFRIPVYFVLTRSECLPGFAAFIDEGLEPACRDRMLGWSAPYGVDEVFVEGWIDEGLLELRRGLEALQTTVLLQLDDEALHARLVDDVFSFSRDIQDLDEPLATLLMPAMRTTSFQSPAIFRGLFLTASPTTVDDGQPQEAEEEEPRLGAVRPRGHAFVRDLFEAKIFREHRLAEPSRFFASARQVAVYRWRIAVGVAFTLALIGLAYQWSGRADRADVTALLDKIQAYEDRSREFGYREQTFDDLRPAAVDIIDAMGRLEHRRVATIAAPTSYVSGIDRTVTEAFAVGMVDSVLPGILDGLTHRLRAILRNAVQTPSETSTVSAFERFAISIDNLQKLVGDLKEFDARISDFEQITVGHSLEPLPRLAAYALSHPSANRLDPTNPLFEFDMSRWAIDFPLPIQDWRKAAEQDMQAEVGPRIELIYKSTPLFSTLVRISRALQDLIAGDRRRSAGATRSQLTELADWIARAEILLADNSTNWLESGELFQNPSITSLLTEVGQLSFVGGEKARELLARRDRARAQARGEALALPGLNDLPLLVETSNGIELAPIYPALKIELIALLNSPYLSATSNQQSVGPRSSTSFQWDVTRLQDILDALEWRQSAVIDAISRLPARFGPIVDRFVESHLEERFEAQILSAQRPLAVGAGGGTTRDAAEIRAFGAAEPVIAAVDQGLSVVGMPRSLGQLRDAAVPQAERLLRNVDLLLESQGPYELYDPLLTSWDGTGPLATGAFGVGNIAALRSLLSDTRGFVEILSGDRAAPLVNYLGTDRRFQTAAAERLVQKWQGIAAALADYQAKKPRNGLAMLEQFILAEMDKITIDTYREATSGEQVGTGYFGQKHYEILLAIRERCATLESETMETAYAALKREFDRTLAGRFPFVGMGPRAPLTDFGAIAKSVEPTAVRLFLNANAGRIEKLGRMLAAPEYASTAGGQAAAEFVGGLDDMRTALAPMLAQTQPPPTLAYRMRFTFRTNAGVGSADEQILEWTASSGSRTISSFGTEDTLVWTQGDPITVSLRWARNAPQLPANTQSVPAVVDGPNITFSYADRWAIFSLLGAHAPGTTALDTLPDPTPNILSFKIALRTNPEAAQGLGVSSDTATAYARIDLFPGATPPQPSDPPEQPVDMPYFPAATPRL